jgi:hypothetical protein
MVHGMREAIQGVDVRLGFDAPMVEADDPKIVEGGRADVAILP